MYLLGYDIGSSSVKASLVDVEGGTSTVSASSPDRELEIISRQPGWAEQDPETWWKHVVLATRMLLDKHPGPIHAEQIRSIGISYQMHGLVVVDHKLRPLRPSIIWCDGRAVTFGEKANEDLGREYCLEHFLNSPGNFTASKLKWVKENEPDIYNKIHKCMLPGDYIAMKMTGETTTTRSGLSEGILWDYKAGGIAKQLLDYYQIEENILPPALENMGHHGELSSKAADELGLEAGTPLSYRAGDQPNNALSLNVMDTGEAAATAGTSGVIYGVTDRPVYDPKSRVNTFIHVTPPGSPVRYGVLLCINGTGIQYSWIKNRILTENTMTYEQLNKMAETVSPGSEGVTVLPFGNGPERPLENNDTGAHIAGIRFNRHGLPHLIRAAQEGIAFSLNYGLQIMEEMGLGIETIRVGNTNLFQSNVFLEAFANSTGKNIEIYQTDGSIGAALGAGIGSGIYKNRDEAFGGLQKIKSVDPKGSLVNLYAAAYKRWLNVLEGTLDNISSMT